MTGSGGGSKRDPQWFRNLRAASRAHIQLGATRTDVGVRVAEEAERDELWRAVIVARAPAFARYEEKSGRVIRSTPGDVTGQPLVPMPFNQPC